MKETIEFKKDIIFNTNIGEITEIDLEHDYKVLDDMIEGDFTVDGSYKIRDISLKQEKFNYNIPFTIGISDRIDKDSINLVINDFNYDYMKDVLSLKIKLDMFYSEIETEEDEISSSVNEYVETNSNQSDSLDINNEIENIKNNNEILTENKEISENNIISESEPINKESTLNELSSYFSDSEYVTYKIYNVKEEDSINSICNKFSVTEKIIKELNKTDSLNIGDKIIIPIFKNEE